MKRILSLLLVLLAAIAAAPAARATTISVSSQQIRSWHYTTAAGTGTVELRIYADRSFVTSDGRPVLPGAPGSGAAYKIVRCDVAGPDADGNYTLTIPTFSIDSTTDAQDAPGKAARYLAYFYTPQGRQLAPYEGFTSFRVLAAYPASPATLTSWALIRADVTSGVVPALDLIRYTNEQIDRIVSAAVGGASGIHMVNGLAADSQTLAGSTNISIVSSGSTHTFSLVGPVATALGGTGATTPSGARGNLGAAASGPNSDITSLAGLTTPLSSPQGGTGIGAYVAGDLLYASSTSALARLADVAPGAVLVSGGVGAPPVWSTSPTFAGATLPTLTISGIPAGRVPYTTTGGLITSSSTLLFDGSHVSIGTTAADETVTLGNAGYVGARNAGGSATRRLIGLDGSNVVQLASSGDPVAIGGPVFNNIAASADLGTSDLATYIGGYQISPVAGWLFTRGTYSTNGSGNNFHLASYATTTGTRPTTALFGQVVVKGAGGQGWGGNAVGLIDNGGAGGSVHAVEGNFGVVDNSSGSAVGFIAGAVGTASTVAGANYSYYTMQVSTPGAPNSAATNGITIINTGISAITGSVLTTSGPLSAVTGIDLAGGSFLAGAFNAPYGPSNGYSVNNSTNTGRNYALASTANAAGGAETLQVGDVSGFTSLRFMPGSAAEALRLQANRRAGFNSDGVTLTHQVQARTSTTRAITGTVATNAGSPTVLGTGSTFAVDFRPGNTVRINGVNYVVGEINSQTSLTLTTNAASTLTAQAATSDDPMLLVESADGHDFVEVNGLGTLLLTDDAPTYGTISSALLDNEGALQIRSRNNAAHRLVFGYDDVHNAAFINSILAKDYTFNNLTYGDLLINAGSQTGKVAVGTSQPTALFTVEVSGAKTADVIGSQFNNIATSTSTFTKIGAAYTLVGSWTGSAIGLRPEVSGGLDATNNRSNFPVVAHGGMNLFAPPLAVSPAFAPTAALHVIGYPTQTITGTPTDLVTASVTNGSTSVSGVGTSWASSLQPGQAIQFGADTAVYTIASIASNTSLALTIPYAGTTATVETAFADPVLFRLANGQNTERFAVYSSGLVVLGGKLRVKDGGTVASAASIDLAPYVGNKVHVSGTATIQTIAAGSDGDWVTLVFDSTASVNEAGNVVLGGAYTATANSTLTVMFDATAGRWLEKGRAIN